MANVVRPQGSMKLELLRKGVHALAGVAVVLLFYGQVLTLEIFGLLILVLAAVVLFNYSYEKELLMRIISINRSDAKIPGLDLLAYFIGMWLVLWLFPGTIAFAAIMIAAFGDPMAHLVSRSFGATGTVVTKNSYWYGTLAGTLAGALAAWLPGYVGLVPALIASGIAMFVEAGELRIADHHIDDNLTIPLVSAIVLWVIAYVL